MIGLLPLLCLALALPPMPGVEAQAAPASGIATIVPDGPAPTIGAFPSRFERPSRPSREDDPAGLPVEPATAKEIETEEESGGSGHHGLPILASADPFAVGSSRLASRSPAEAPGLLRRPTSRLRC